ncbi:MAG: hypothetical protein ABEJ98_03710 [Candidatus Nanohaloarchaea archaeon]
MTCDYCGKKEAVTTCEACGSQVCEDCKLEYGCKACGGGKTRFD